MVTKEHILQEIKRTTEENGGRALGWRKFESETGINYSDWRGKYWVRWSDAVREAGFAPNQLSTAYDDGELLAKFAQLARELAHLPVDGELRMKSRRDSSFPSTSTFERLGGKMKLVRRLHEYCLSREDCDDVAQMCDAYLPRTKIVLEKNKDREVKVGFVYLMKSGQFYKIGHSGAPGCRQYDLTIQLPEKVELIHKIPTEAPEAAERFWHERFQAKRKGGEWFDLTASDVKSFRRCKSM